MARPVRATTLALGLASLLGACAEGEGLPDGLAALAPEAVEAARESAAPPPAPPVLVRAPGLSWRALGKRMLDAGRPTRADIAFRRALVEDAGDVEALAGAGLAAAAGGRLARAEYLLSAARRLAPEREDVNLALGDVLLRRGEVEAARRVLRTAFVVSSGRSDLAAERLSDAEARLGRDAEADPSAAAIAFRLARTGRSEFRLVAMETEAPADAAPGGAARAEAGAGVATEQAEAGPVATAGTTDAGADAAPGGAVAARGSAVAETRRSRPRPALRNPGGDR